MRLPALAVWAAAALAVAACRSEPPAPPPEAATVGEADVERFRAETFLAASDLDAALAELEGDAEAQSDTLARDIYRSELARLRAERLRFQARVDSLRPVDPEAFARQQDTLRAALAGLERRVRQSRYTLAPTPAALRAAASGPLAGVDAALAPFRADTLQAARVAPLEAQRQTILAQLEQAGAADSLGFVRFREAIARGLVDLTDRTRGLAPDTTRAPRPR